MVDGSFKYVTGIGKGYKKWKGRNYRYSGNCAGYYRKTLAEQIIIEKKKKKSMMLGLQMNPYGYNYRWQRSYSCER
jgi:hypothetical protein